MKIGLCVDDNSGFSVEEARDLDLGVVRKIGRPHV